MAPPKPFCVSIETGFTVHECTTSRASLSVSLGAHADAHSSCYAQRTLWHAHIERGCPDVLEDADRSLCPRWRYLTARNPTYPPNGGGAKTRIRKILWRVSGGWLRVCARRTQIREGLVGGGDPQTGGHVSS